MRPTVTSARQGSRKRRWPTRSARRPEKTRVTSTVRAKAVKKMLRGLIPCWSDITATKLMMPPYPKEHRKRAMVTATTRHSTSEPPRRRSWLSRAATLESGGRRQAMAAITRFRTAIPDAEPGPAVPVHPQARRRGHRGGEHRGHAPVADPLGPPALRDHLGHVGRGRGEQARPEDAVEEDEDERQPVAVAEGVGDGEAGDRQARDQQHAPLPHAVGEGARHRGRQGRGVGEHPEEEPGHGGRAAQVEDAEGRRRQQLEERQEDREREPAHHEEARGEERRCRSGLGRRWTFAHSAGASPRNGSQARSSGPFSVQTAKRSALFPSLAYIETPAYSPFLLTA